MPTPRIAYLGPEGTFTHQTALQWVETDGPPGAELAAYPSREAAIAALQAGEADYAVVAVATSLSGPLGPSPAELREAGLHEVEEITRVCHYHLLGRPGANLDRIAEVHSVPKALDDCTARLRRLVPGATLVPTASTAAGVAAVAADGRPEIAAVGTDTAAERYGLAILVENIEDDPNNWTRWSVLERAR